MLSAYALSINSGSYSLFCKKEKPVGFSFLLFHEKDRKEKLLQLHFVHQPFPFLLPFGDIFPRPGEVFPRKGELICCKPSDASKLALRESWRVSA